MVYYGIYSTVKQIQAEMLKVEFSLSAQQYNSVFLSGFLYNNTYALRKAVGFCRWRILLIHTDSGGGNASLKLAIS